MHQRIAAAVASAIALLGAGHAATVFTEGFEGTQISSSWRVFDAFGQFVTIEGAGIEIQRSGTVVNAYEGNQYVELDSDRRNGGDRSASSTNSSMAALANLVTGAQHTLTFAYQPRTNGLADNGIRVAIGALNNTGAGFSFIESMDLGSVDGQRNTYGGWQVISMAFRAGLGDNAIMFSAFGADNTLGGFLDDVTVMADMNNIQQTPIPAAGLLLGTGLFALARRRRS